MSNSRRFDAEEAEVEMPPMIPDPKDSVLKGKMKIQIRLSQNSSEFQSSQEIEEQAENDEVKPGAEWVRGTMIDEAREISMTTTDNVLAEETPLSAVVVQEIPSTRAIPLDLSQKKPAKPLQERIGGKRRITKVVILFVALVLLLIGLVVALMPDSGGADQSFATFYPTGTATGTPTAILVIPQQTFPSHQPSSSPTTIMDMETLIALIRSVEPTVSFADPSSPQSRALDWLLLKDKYTLRSNDAWIQRFAIVTLALSTNGHVWKQTARWLLPGVHECRWALLSCNENQVVEAIFLGAVGLSGTLPPEIGLLHHLHTVDLFRNQNLTGSLPTQLGQLTQLTTLYLHENSLTGTIISQLPSSLQQLLLSANRLTGSIPASLGHSRLTDLRMDRNHLVGSLPTELGHLTDLSVFSTIDNQLTGVIPSEMGHWTKLQLLGVSRNHHSGSLPTQLGRLTNLLRLEVADNMLSGSIPSEVGALTHLTFLVAFLNQLTGSLPTQLGRLTALTSLSLGANQLTGTLPPEMSTQLTLLEIVENNLEGTIPTEWGRLTLLVELGLYRNALTGRIPSEMGHLTKIQSLYLYENRLFGLIPTELGRLTDLSLLALSVNRLTGSVPHQLNVVDLYLHRNRLRGLLPTLSTRLQTLFLYDNQLSGSIPLLLCANGLVPRIDCGEIVCKCCRDAQQRICT